MKILKECKTCKSYIPWKYWKFYYILPNEATKANNLFENNNFSIFIQILDGLGNHDTHPFGDDEVSFDR